MIITDEMCDEVEQALYQAALQGSAPAAKWLLANRRPESWGLEGAPDTGPPGVLLDAIQDSIAKLAEGGFACESDQPVTSRVARSQARPDLETDESGYVKGWKTEKPPQWPEGYEWVETKGDTWDAGISVQDGD